MSRISISIRHEYTVDMLRVAVLVACYNRSAKTETWLKSLFSEVPGHWNLTVFAVDDGSTDATPAVLANSRMKVKVCSGTGSWFWAKSMSVAEDMALSADEFDYILWANDDTEYFQGGLKYVEEVRSSNPSCIIVGKFVDPESGFTVYGGLRKTGHNPFKYSLIQSDRQNSKCDNFHGNFVLIPILASQKIGRIDGNYKHAYADYDYGERARRSQVEIVSTGRPIGTCLDNKKDFGQINKLSSRMRYVFGPKGLPIKSQVRYLRKYGSPLWVRYLIQPYIRAVLGINSKKR